jgi:hypothetical protein
MNVGHGVCRHCWAEHDVYYIMARPIEGDVKPGITSGDPGRRMNVHASYMGGGFTECVFLRENLPRGMAYAGEQKILTDLWNAGHAPFFGREYFRSEARDLLLSLAEDYFSESAIAEWAACLEMEGNEHETT